VVLLVVCLAAGLELFRYEKQTWAAIIAIAAGAQLLGHSMFNYALHRTSATTVSVLILLETPGAAVLAWVWLGQTPRVVALPGVALLLIGVAVVVIGGAREARAGATAALADGAAPTPGVAPSDAGKPGSSQGAASACAGESGSSRGAASACGGESGSSLGVAPAGADDGPSSPPS
jgi:hypothetical protein